MKIITFCKREETLSDQEIFESLSFLISSEKPDIILCSGWTFSDSKWLKKIQKKLFRNTNIFLEIYSPYRGVCRSHQKAYRLCKGKKPQFLGKQCFSTPNETTHENIQDLIDLIPKRTFQINTFSVFVLICGEIFILRTKDSGEVCLKNENEMLVNALNSDIILNIIHFRMRNKRKYTDLETFYPKAKKLSSNNGIFSYSANVLPCKGQRNFLDMNHGLFRNKRRKNGLCLELNCKNAKAEIFDMDPIPTPDQPCRPALMCNR